MALNWKAYTTGARILTYKKSDVAWRVPGLCNLITDPTKAFALGSVVAKDMGARESTTDSTQIDGTA